MDSFADLNDVITLTGKSYTSSEQERISALLPLVSNALRFEARKVDRDLDEMIRADKAGAYCDVVKLVTVDVVARVLRQSFDGDPMSQESQGGLGYTWSGTYAIPGGGIAAAIMKNDLKRLGLKRQRISTIEMWGGSEDGEA